MSQLATVQQKTETVRGLLERMKPQMALALPKHLSADRMCRIALTTCLRNPRLLDCDLKTLAGGIMELSAIGLEPDGRKAVLVPFSNKKRGVDEAKVIIMYQGLLDLVWRSGQLASVDCRVVCEGDFFEFEFGAAPRLRHIPKAEPTKDGCTHAYAVAQLKGGGVMFEVMTKKQIEGIRLRSKASDDGPWVTDYCAMAAKSALRKLCHLLPSSVEVQRAVALDEEGDNGTSQRLDTIVDVEHVIVDTKVEESPTMGGALGKIVEERKKFDVQSKEKVTEVLGGKETKP